MSRFLPLSFVGGKDRSRDRAGLSTLANLLTLGTVPPSLEYTKIPES